MVIIDDERAKRVIQESYDDGFTDGIIRANANFSVAVNKGLIGFCAGSGVNSVDEALDYVIKHYTNDVLEFEAEMKRIRNNR